MSWFGSGACIAPALREWIASQLRDEAAVMKERRKHNEEKVLARTNQLKPNPKAGGAPPKEA